jgi:hypothetical protein
VTKPAAPLPHALDEIARIAGEDAARRVAEAAGGTAAGGKKKAEKKKAPPAKKGKDEAVGPEPLATVMQGALLGGLDVRCVAGLSPALLEETASSFMEFVEKTWPVIQKHHGKSLDDVPEALNKDV